MARVVKEVSDMEIDEISLVDRPANQHAKVVITKNFSEEEAMPDIYDEDGDILDFNEVSEGDVVFDETGEAFVVVDEEMEYDDIEEEELEEVGKANPFSAANKWLHSTPVTRAKDGKKVGELTDTDKWNMKRVKGAAAVAGGGTAAAGGGAAYAYKKKGKEKVDKSFSDELREELSKSLTSIERDEVIAKALGQVDEMAQSLAEAEEIAKSERDLRLIREYTEVAKSYNVPVDPDELAPVLMAIAEHLPYEYGEVIHKALGAAGDLIFEEIGYQGQADNNDVLSQVDAYIEQNVSKSDISKAEAVEAVFADNPDAYDEYLSTRSFR